MKPRRKQYERSAETSTRILDAAQKLFADNGYEGVSMRAVAAEAKVNLASIVYYFDSKKGLFRAVLSRFAGPLNEERARLLEQADRNPTLESYMMAFVEPAFRVMTDDALGGRDYARLLWRLPHESVELWEEVGKPYDSEVVEQYKERIRKFVPHMSAKDFSWHNHIVSSMFLATLGKCADEAHWSRDIWIGDKDYILKRLVKTTCLLLSQDSDECEAGSGEGKSLKRA